MFRNGGFLKWVEWVRQCVMYFRDVHHLRGSRCPYAREHATWEGYWGAKGRVGKMSPLLGVGISLTVGDF